MADEYRHRDYRSWMLSQPCCCQPCTRKVLIHHHTSGETEPHRKSRGGRRGRGQRASDTNGMPLCPHHHSDLHDRTGLSGFFADFDKKSLRIWQDDQVERLQRMYAMAHPEPLVAGTRPTKRSRIGIGWTVATVRDWLRKEARTRPGQVAAALDELADLIERDTL